MYQWNQLFNIAIIKKTINNGRLHIRCFIPQAIFYSLMLLKMGITIVRNTSS